MIVATSRSYPKEATRAPGRPVAGPPADAATLHSDATVDDYYRLPDHWILHDLQQEEHFTKQHGAYVGRVVELLKQSGVRTALEVGCGDGWNCARLVDAGIETVGTDWSANAIAYASMLARGARFFCGDVRDAAFAARFPEPFDAVLMIEVIEHIPPDDCVAALRNIARLARPGGRLVLTTPSTNFANRNDQHYRHFDEASVRELVGQARGLTIDSIEGYGDVPAEQRYHRLARWVDNRYYQIKPAKRWLQRKCEPQWLDTPLSRCAGLIVALTRSA